MKATNWKDRAERAEAALKEIMNVISRPHAPYTYDINDPMAVVRAVKGVMSNFRDES